MLGERFTATEKKYLEDVAQEVLSNHRNSDVDEWLATQPRLENCGALKSTYCYGDCFIFLSTDYSLWHFLLKAVLIFVVGYIVRFKFYKEFKAS